MENLLMTTCEGIQPYLVLEQSSYSRMLLARFRCGSFFRLVTFPETDWSNLCARMIFPHNLICTAFCSANIMWSQEKFLIPTLNSWGLNKCRDAFLKLQQL